MFDILSVLPGKKKRSSTGWVSFNAVCCSFRGHKPDKRMRGGIKFDGPTNWVLNCFNCGYTCNFVHGKSISSKTRQVLLWCDIDPDQIQRWNLESLQHKDVLDLIIGPKLSKKIAFRECTLPDGEVLDSNNPAHKKFCDYLTHRGISPGEYPFIITPKAVGRFNNRIIVPYTYQNKLVGYTSRFLDNASPKYLNEQQPGYVFGYDFQKSDWSACIVVEGIFDALSINACAVMHNTISNNQAMLLRQLSRQIIVVPDMDKSGLEICDRALELGYSVSLPEWAPEVKDVNDAVVKYGRLPTLLSILQSATMSKIKIEMKRNKIGKNRK
jgi:hypothetical protein